MTFAIRENDLFDPTYVEPRVYSGTRYMHAAEEASDYRLMHSMTALERMASLGDDWDGRGSPAPTSENLESARKSIETFWMQVRNSGQRWSSPLISADEVGHLMFEWWRGEKKLTIYVFKNGGKYLKINGPNIFTDMEEGVVGLACFSDLWKWLQRD